MKTLLPIIWYLSAGWGGGGFVVRPLKELDTPFYYELFINFNYHPPEDEDDICIGLRYSEGQL